MCYNLWFSPYFIMPQKEFHLQICNHLIMRRRIETNIIKRKRKYSEVLENIFTKISPFTLRLDSLDSTLVLFSTPADGTLSCFF